MAGEEGVVRRCVECDRPISDDASVCPHCGRDYRPVMMGKSWEWENSPLPPVGGALVAVAGLTLILSGLLWTFEDFSPLSDGWDTNRTMNVMIGLAAIGIGVFAVSVSPFAMTRRRLALSLAGGIASLGAWGIVVTYVLASIVGILGLVGVILIALSKDEFVD